MTSPKDYQAFYLDERNSALLYQTLSEVEKDERLSEVYRRLSQTELTHAQTWTEKLEETGHQVPEFRPTWRTRTLIWLARRFGPNLVLPALQNMEQTGTQDYLQMAGNASMAQQEQFHGLLIRNITRVARGGMEGGVLAQLEGRHRGGGNALRAAVLGANDGLVSNLSLVMGVAGATMNGRTILITGLAGMLAGAISMALGEWLSVQSSRELYQHQIRIETQEVETAPEEEAQELALIYEARGLSREEAQALSDRILSDRSSAVETLAREELGIDPQELGGSAWEAALTSFVLFTIGAIIPVIGFTFLAGTTAVFVSILSSIVGLFILGSVITLFTGRSIFSSGMRMVIFGLLAAAVTYGIGHLIGTSIGG
jgi:VIT1/CCC1 family predicted Fe2+/Mn2+ transporter